MLGPSLKLQVFGRDGKGWDPVCMDGGVDPRVSCCYPLQHLSPKQGDWGCSTPEHTVWGTQDRARIYSPNPPDWAPLGSEQCIQNAASHTLCRRQDGAFSETKKGKMSYLWHSGSEQELQIH